MSKINAVRLVNINYNNNAIRISDECFHFNGESTLMSLRNGGGKSVLVQMMMAPFVHKKYRNAKDRPFESYFTTNKPSFILVEWVLDQGAGYVMTGMMVRRNQNLEDDGQADALEMINFISEYRESCIHDIHHLPIVEKNKKEMILKNFSSCRQLFETYKKDRSVQFFYYDMNNASQSRQYFDKLLEYKINYKEWETIIKKVNLKESGLSDLFADCRDEKGLVEKWFLDAVESKLNKEKNRMKEFQIILEKYAGQYKDNQSKIRRRDVIRNFKEESVRIREKAELYQAAEEKERKQENKIACFYRELGLLCENTEIEHKKILESVDEVRTELARVEYESLSSQVHMLEKKERYCVSNRDIIAVEQEQLERNKEKTERRIHLLQCAQKQNDVDAERKELELTRERLRVLQKKEEKLEPERKELGSRLCAYYASAVNENQLEQEKNQEKLQMVIQESKELQAESETLEEKIHECVGKAGEWKGKQQIYDRIEEDFCRRYKENLIRNILGVYEPGTLDIMKKTYQQQMDITVRARGQKIKQRDRSQEHLRGLERNQISLHDKLASENAEWKRQNEVKAEYEAELEARKVILKYLDLDEKVLFDKEIIIQTAERKRHEIDSLKRNLEKEEDDLQKEYQRLTQGKTLEIPHELEQEILSLGIPLVYGMEWMQKNGYTEDENRQLIHQHPFLPYALILSKHDVERLKNSTGTSYTSFPIPIIFREELVEEREVQDGTVVSLSGVSFYILFNENLLNEEKLRQLVQEKERLIRKKRDAVSIRQKESEEYFKRQQEIANQKVTKEFFKKNLLLLKELEMHIEELDQSQRRNSEEINKQREELENLDKEIQEMKEQIRFMERRQEEFEKLEADYDAYLQTCKKLEECRKQIEKHKERKGLVKNRLEQLYSSSELLKMEIERQEQAGKELQGRYLLYEKYAEPVSQELLSPETAEALTIRYIAITEKMSAGLRELEEQEQKEAKRYEKAVDGLMHLSRKYRLSGDEWKDISYNRKEESHQEALLEDYEKKLQIIRSQWSEENTKIAVLVQQIKDLMKRILDECGHETILPEVEIKDEDFAERKSQLCYQEQEILKTAKNLERRIHSYNENLTALSEYSHFQSTEPIEWEEIFSEMNEKELRNFKGVLIRDYSEMVEDRRIAKDKLAQVLNQIVRKEQFQESFYKKPLESMLELTDEASQVLRQLDTTLQSYDSLMEKLEIDISLVEKEKDKIVELLEEYVREVHQNMGMIDRNSTIVIREKPVKMLKIQIPDWEENANIYRIRLQDMIDDVTLKGVEIFENNGNAQEYFGTRITTRNLYDTVIGIGNVQIRLYKIEEQREYPITWADVAKNSGGEGFLSAFVVLSSLLYYMRKDETDIFADRNEGKVLVMDNPFAQTNAAHLLKPLMDMAKKTNTQLICLTGLGGESIYNRFDNIYVMNLIAASLRNGLQYLKVDHVRGNEPETMIVSQIEVMEQQRLIF